MPLFPTQDSISQLFTEWVLGTCDLVALTVENWSLAGDYGFRISWKFAIPRNTQIQKCVILEFANSRDCVIRQTGR